MSFRGGLDLEGRIVIKVRLGNDVRKMLIHNDDITYDELALMMQRIYKGAIKQDDELTIKYKDEDGDLITIFDSSDVSFAIQTCNRQLKLVLYVNGLERNFDDAEVATIKKGLRDVRDMVNNLLDQIDAKNPPPDRLDSVEEAEEASAHDEPQPSHMSAALQQPPIDSKEFDPLDASGLTTQLDSTGGSGDKTGSHGQYSTGSQYSGEQVAKSFDQLSMSDRQSVNQSPTPSTLQSSFGTSFNVNTSQQMPGSHQPPASTGQMATSFPSQTAGAPSMSTAGGYYSNPAASSQYGSAQPSSTMQQQQPPQQTQQQPQQSFNYNQSWQQQNPSQQTQPMTSTMPPGPQQPTSQPQAQPMAPQPQYGGYGMPGQPPQQQQQPPQAMYGQPQQPIPGAPAFGGSGSPNPYSKPGQIRGSYPRATGNYPQLAQPGQMPRPAFPPQQ